MPRLRTFSGYKAHTAMRRIATCSISMTLISYRRVRLSSGAFVFSDGLRNFSDSASSDVVLSSSELSSSEAVTSNTNVSPRSMKRGVKEYFGLLGDLARAFSGVLSSVILTPEVWMERDSRKGTLKELGSVTAAPGCRSLLRLSHLPNLPNRFRYHHGTQSRKLVKFHA